MDVSNFDREFTESTVDSFKDNSNSMKPLGSYQNFTYEADKFNNSTTEKMDMEWGKQEKSC